VRSTTVARPVLGTIVSLEHFFNRFAEMSSVITDAAARM
jgi:hypothetical protein